MSNEMSTDTSASCVSYLENYLDCIESLPDDLQKRLTKMRELDVSYQGYLKDITKIMSQYGELKKCERNGIQMLEEDRKRLLRKLQTLLISAQEIGDEKVNLVQNIQDSIDARTHSLDKDYRNIVLVISSAAENTAGPSDDEQNAASDAPPAESVSANTSTAQPAATSVANVPTSPTESSTVAKETTPANGSVVEHRHSKRSRRRGTDADANGPDHDTPHHHHNNHHHRHHHHSEHGGSIPMPRATATLQMNQPKKCESSQSTTTKKKKRKAKYQSSYKEEMFVGVLDEGDDDDDMPVDPDEPTYCLCDQISYGEMIGCDNDLCPIEWFHFGCVALFTKPKGKWYCPKCRGERANVMKSKSQFMKVLEKYNREKEEKAHAQSQK